VAPPPAPAPGASGDGGTDSLITSIEETLARIDEGVPLAPSEIQPPPAQPPATEPPVVMTQPIYPPPADIAPPPGIGGIEPSYNVTPPPATVDGYGYGGYSTGPVPPEPVPDFYPQTPQFSPATPGLYPSDSYAFPPPETIEQTEVRRPGIVRRTLAKAGSAVGRVFDRN
jgi:hypothetical protein